MDALRPLFALTLLIALAMGGVVMPVVHEATHLAERVEGTHDHSDHHQLEGDHTAEVQLHSPEVAETECALCSAPPITSVANLSAVFSVSESPLPIESSTPWAATDDVPRAARGPPAA
ncbi:MAG: hypothetical protein AAF170_19930 [Bacteroidota bacterium]